MRSSPAAAAVNNDVLSYVSCIQRGTGQKHKSCFSNDLRQRGEGEGRSGEPQAGIARCWCVCQCKSQILWSVGL